MKSHALQNRVMLITGAGKGIGRAVVESLLERSARDFPGLKLHLVSRTASDLEDLAALGRHSGVSLGFSACDLAENPCGGISDCLQRFGRLDALIHSAGVGRFGDFLDLTEADLSHTMRTNVHATFLLLQKAYGAMRAQSPTEGLRGQIQVVTSVAAERPFPHSALYCMSKFAQRGLVEVLRDYGRQDSIRILEIRPGAAITPMWGEVGPEQGARMMEARDVAEAMVNALLVSPRATLETLTLRPIHGDI